jgi:hypothetical protein
MVNVKQYPYFLYKRASQEATQNANGSWVVSSAETWSLCGSCRDEPNGAGKQIQVASGEYITFGSLIQLPKDVMRIPEGTEVLVTTTELADPSVLLSETYKEGARANGEIRVSGTCLKHDLGQLHGRLWV